jgi:hypothetical protein
MKKSVKNIISSTNLPSYGDLAFVLEELNEDRAGKEDVKRVLCRAQVYCGYYRDVPDTDKKKKDHFRF